MTAGRPPKLHALQAIIARQIPAGTGTNSGNQTARNTGLPGLTEIFRQSSGVVAYDHGWQFPALTEQHAYHRVRDTLTPPEGVIYVAYPWATLIDKLQSKAKDANEYLRQFREFCELLPTNTIRITVCQQIYMRDYLALFADAGIDHVFWAHATLRDVEDTACGAARPAIHPFPLYPVQIAEALPSAAIAADGQQRRLLFSFVGARADKHYPRQTRNYILDLLNMDPRGYVAGRTNWFYEKIVYHHQIHQFTDAPPDALIEQDQASEFRAVLEDSTFSLCPAGTGPNSIRLWESIGAGAIPVILADDWAPPGNRALWNAACLFRPETAEAVAILPDELAALAADPIGLAARRHALRQLWMLYGTGGFVHDIHNLAQALNLDEAGSEEAQIVPQSTEDAARLLSRLAARMLIDHPTAMMFKAPQDPLLQQAAEALGLLEPGHPVRRHFEAVAATRGTAIAPRRQAPAVLRRAVPTLHYFGRHANRTPLSYEPFLREVGNRMAFADRPEDADLLLTGFNLDFRDAAPQLTELLRAEPALKLLVLSEEPLWDLYWSGGFIETERQLENGIDYRFLNHENSSIFDFDRYPYFALTADSFAATYALRIEAMARLSPTALLAQWETAAVPAAFFAEHRTASGTEPAAPEREFWGMSAHRTQVAEAVREQLPDTLCVGQGWREQVRRQELASWHLDKLAMLAGRTRICSAIENTHQHCYISEKLFDAFAVGAIPIYCAGTRQRALELVPDEAMINIAGLDVVSAARRIVDFRPDAAFAEAWLETARRLARMFGDTGAVRAERIRIAEACLEAVHQQLDTSATMPSFAAKGVGFS